MKSIKNFTRIIKFIALHPLNSKHQFKAIFSFFKWQLAMRLIKRRVIIPWVDDASFVVGLGETGLTGNIYAGLMEYEDMAFLLHALRSDEIFVDVGANVGAYTILASKVVKSHSVAFEPLPSTAQRLRDQVRINEIESFVDMRSIGIGNKQEILSFTNNQDTTNKVCLEIASENITRISVSTLDFELTDTNQYFIKIDVEGFEHNVIEGATRVLSSGNISALIIELNGSGEYFGHSNHGIHEKLLKFGYFPVAYEPKTRNIIQLTDFNKNGGNTIYIRDFQQISERCKLAPKRVIHTAHETLM